MDRGKNFFDMIGSLIPGYNGYAEREGRRNCDKILRESIFSELAVIEKTIYERINTALSVKNKELAEQLDVIRKKTNTLSSKVRYAPHGASPFFSDNQIKEDELLLIYQIDYELLKLIKDLKNDIKTINLLEIENLLGLCFDTFSKRDSIIIQLK